MGECLEVTITQMQTCKAPSYMRATNLLSDVCIALWDEQAKVGGMVEIIRPYAGRNASFRDVSQYADTAIPELLRRVLLLGAERERVTAVVGGGAIMHELEHMEKKSQMGLENVQAVRRILDGLDIPVREDYYSLENISSVIFHPGDGSFLVSTSQLF